MGCPDADDFADASGDLEARLRERDGFHLLLDLREFDGWQGLAAIIGHLSLAREHAAQAQRVAGRFLNAETRYFPGEAFEAAKMWLTGD